MEDLEDNTESPQLLKKPRKKGDTTWRKFSSVESSSSDSGVMVGYASSSSESSARSASEASLVSGIRRVSISSSSAAEGADRTEAGRTSDPAVDGADKSDPQTLQVSEPQKVLAGFGRSTDVLKGSPALTTVTEVDTQSLAKLEQIPDEEDEDGHQLFRLVEPLLQGVKVKERTATQLKRLPRDIVEELIRPFLLEAIDNPEGVAALIERFLLARREITALQALKTTTKRNKQGIGSSSSAAGGAELRGPAPKLRCQACFTTWPEQSSHYPGGGSLTQSSRHGVEVGHHGDGFQVDK
jgi:hypothetical protein